MEISVNDLKKLIDKAIEYSLSIEEFKHCIEICEDVEKESWSFAECVKWHIVFNAC